MTSRLTSPAFAAMMRALAAAEGEPLGHNALAAAAQLAGSTVRTLTGPARSAGYIHIAAWRVGANGGAPRPLFVIGPGKSPPPPAPLTASAKSRAWRRRIGRTRGKVLRAQAAGKSMLATLLSL